MKLVMTLLARDEADIIAANLEFHLAQGVDFVIATDNLSEDGTPDILRQYERAGVLHLIQERADDFNQGDWVTRMARLAATRFAADWVIESDADEFWWPRDGSLREALEAVHEAVDVVAAERSNFLGPRSGSGPFFDRMVTRQRDSANAFGEPLPPKVCHRAHPDVRVHQGNHAVDWQTIGQTLADDRIEILHFPIRSYRQFENKIAKGGAAYERNQKLPSSEGHVWRQLYERYRVGELPQVYAQLVPGEADIEHCLQQGSLIRDTRLQEHLEHISDSTLLPGALKSGLARSPR